QRLDVARILAQQISFLERREIAEHAFVAPLHSRFADAIQSGLIGFQPQQNQIAPTRSEDKCLQAGNLHLRPSPARVCARRPRWVQCSNSKDCINVSISSSVKSRNSPANSSTSGSASNMCRTS